VKNNEDNYQRWRPLGLHFWLCGVLEDLTSRFPQNQKRQSYVQQSQSPRALRRHGGGVLRAVLGDSPSGVRILGDILKDSAFGFVESSR